MSEDCSQALDELKRATLYFLAIPDINDPDEMDFKVYVSIDQTPEEAIVSINESFPDKASIVYSYDAIEMFDEIRRWNDLNTALGQIDLGDIQD